MKRWIPFALLCVVGGFAWIPLARAGTGIHAADCVVGALLGAAFLMVLPGGALVGTVGTVCVVVGPWLTLLLGEHAPGIAAVALSLTLVPVVIAVAEPAMSDIPFAPSRLWPGLAAAAALLIIAPLPNFADWLSDIVLIALPLVVGIGCVFANHPQGRKNNGSTGLWISAAIFAVIVAAQVTQHEHVTVSVTAILLCAATFALTVLTLRSVSAMQYASQFAAVPLLALLESPFAVSPAVLTGRFALSITLLAAAVVALLRDTSEENLR